MIKVMIDPGHGGTDRNNKGPTGYVEADGVLDISLRLKKKLLSTGSFDVKLTREVDATVGLTARGQMAGNFGAQLMISEHTNADDTASRGTEVFESVRLSDESFAAEMSAAISSALGIPNRGMKDNPSVKYPGHDYYTVIDASVEAGVPHVLLIESAFHDNKEDEAILKDPNKRDLIAEVQAKVICKKFGVQYPSVMVDSDVVLIDAMFNKGLITGRDVWLKAIKGQEPINLDWLKVIFSRAVSKIP